jgi:tetrahydrodipicolinate N-succinyltransferase
MTINSYVDHPTMTETRFSSGEPANSGFNTWAHPDQFSHSKD